MKKLTIIFLSVCILSFYGCSDEFELFQDKGSVVFYTNSQAMISCGQFDVDIYIENKFIGSLSDATSEDSPPDCQNSKISVSKRFRPGDYYYKASFDCGQYGEWTGTFQVATDSCSLIFLDIVEANLNNAK